MTRGGVSPGAAPIAMAKLEAAALGVRPQRPHEGAQDSLDVGSETDTLMLEGGRSREGHRQPTHIHEDFSHKYYRP